MIVFAVNTWPDWIHFISLIIFPVFLYAEMHYRLPFFKGHLYKRQPEILFDLPYRSETGTIPILFLIKDAHWFPVTLDKFLIRIFSRDIQSVQQEITFPVNSQISEKWFHTTIEIDASKYHNQWLNIDCFAYITINQKKLIIRNDNYRTLSQKPFRIFIDTEPLPSEEGWVWGDLHTHSFYTEDQVEFGAPPEYYHKMSKALGMSFCAMTEHSYDMDDQENSWTDNDPRLRKWSKFQKHIADLNNQTPDFIIIPGEEVSVDNGFGRTVHMCVLNDPSFYIGTGDGMEGKLGTETEHHYAKVIDSVSENALIFAAHPFEHPSMLHRVIIHRGSWNRWDYHKRLDGLQILNGFPSIDFEQGRNFWISQLLKGRRQKIYAGNDSHGNFNRFRQIVIPMLFMREHRHQIYGRNLTCVKADLSEGVNGLVESLKSNSVIISNGPFLNIAVAEDKKSISISAKSSSFFGTIQNISVFAGLSGKQEEIGFFEEQSPNDSMVRQIQIPIENDRKYSYFRAEIKTDQKKFALTNPVWFL